jgi:uncharacterized protein
MMTDLTKDECERILTASRYAHLGCCDGDEPYVVPITCIYKDGFLYGFTHEGQKIDLLRKNPKMCVQVEHVAGEHEWESVMCWGMFEEITDEKNKQAVKILFAERHGESILAGEEPDVSPMASSLHLPKDDSAIVYRMQPYRVSGKAERA